MKTIFHVDSNEFTNSTTDFPEKLFECHVYWYGDFISVAKWSIDRKRIKYTPLAVHLFPKERLQ